VRVLLTEPLGADLLVHAELDGEARLTARVEPDADVEAGDWTRLRIDTERLHFFDPDTTLAVR
jgi:ABC-type sugar transport system ATPase subunit